jgi:hypothetical protein
MRTGWMISLAVFCLALPAQAQRERAAGGQERPGMRQGRRMAGGPGQMSPDALARRLAQELELTDEQREEYAEIVASYRQKWEELRGRGQEMRELARELREARESGNTERAEQIRQQMEGFRGGGEEVMLDFLDQVETILDEQQIQRLSQFRERMQRAREDGQRRADMRQLIQRLPDELELSEEQRAEFQEILAAQREQFGQQRERWRELRPLMEELREARAAGDEERVAELERELEQRRPRMPGSEELLEQIEQILTAEQKVKLAELRAQLERRGRELDARRILDTARRLDLNKEQRERLKEITREAMTVRGRVRMDAEARAELAKSVKRQILEMLDAEQAAQFERLLERGSRGERIERERGRRGEGRGADRPEGARRRGGGGGGGARNP